MTPERTILRLRARHNLYRVFVTELFSDEQRKYRYYILREDWIVAGFDNSPDPRAIRQKYGGTGRQHFGELIPQLHLDDKTRLMLTEEMSFDDFIAWIERNIE